MPIIGGLVTDMTVYSWHYNPGT